MKLIDREREHDADYYVFYHGQQGKYRLVQDFWLKIMNMIQADNGKDDFIPVRFPESSEFKNLSFENLIPHNSPPIRCLFDHDDDIATRLLACNIALFGNHALKASSSLIYYFDNDNVTEHDVEEIFRKSFEYYDFNPKFLADLTACQHPAWQYLIIPDSGNLLQIFIPKEKIKQTVYLSKPVGFPVADVEVDSVQQALQHRTDLNAFFKKCETGAVSDYDFKNAQARILITKDIMLNPKSGVKIFRETTLSEEKVKHYSQGIEHITRKIMIDWLKRYINPGEDPKNRIKPEALERIKDTPFGQLIADKQKAQELLKELNQNAKISGTLGSK